MRGQTAVITQAPCTRLPGKLRTGSLVCIRVLSPRSTAEHLGAWRAGTRARWGRGKSLAPAPHSTPPPQTGHQPPLTTDAPALTPSRNGFILEPRCFIKNTDLPKPAQISLLSGGSVKHSTVRDAPEETGGLQRRAKSEASGMMQPWCSEIAGL